MRSISIPRPRVALMAHTPQIRCVWLLFLWWEGRISETAVQCGYFITRYRTCLRLLRASSNETYVDETRSAVDIDETILVPIYTSRTGMRVWPCCLLRLRLCQWSPSRTQPAGSSAISADTVSMARVRGVLLCSALLAFRVSADSLSYGPSSFAPPGAFPTQLYASYYNDPTATSAQPQPVISDPVLVRAHYGSYRRSVLIA